MNGTGQGQQYDANIIYNGMMLLGIADGTSDGMLLGMKIGMKDFE